MSSPIFKRWFAIAALVFVLTVACGILLIAITPKVCVASAQIAVAARGVIDQVGIIDNSLRPLDETTAPGEIEIIQSAEVLQPIIADLQLDKKWAKRIPTNDLLTYLHSHLKFTLKAGTNIITISVSSDVPTEAANIANAIADRYKTMRDAEVDQRQDRGLNAFRAQITYQEKVVADAQGAVEQLKNKLLVGGVPTEMASADLEKRKADLLTAQEDYDARQVLWKRLAPLSDREFMDTLRSLGGHYSTIETSSDLPMQVAGLKRDMQIDCDMAKSRVVCFENKWITSWLLTPTIPVCVR